ncbi:L,D-transpeptidase [bacterium]|nr:L,D-transpeptidase [bacterium]
MKPKFLIPAAIIVAIINILFIYTSKDFPELDPHQMRPINPMELTGEYDDNNVLGLFHEREVQVPEEKSADVLGTQKVLGKKDQKRIEIDLTKQKLYAYEGNNKIYSFPVSTGKWGRTPTGEFRIWTKLKYSLMAGGSQALGTYYYLPNVPFTMYFANGEVPPSRGYGVHGTYWHDNFGHPMSHGCINMKTEEAEKLFYWANPVLAKGMSGVRADEENTGTRIIIYGEAPQE